MMDCPSTGVAISHWHSPHPTVEFAARQVDSLAEPGEQKDTDQWTAKWEDNPLNLIL